ncbi:hypothetical protein [Halopelagius fulvigenes]|uniref:Uncharacterized protein n=1 Tax=Halopelagius fulvigenes TaxID=1198324 RepID=A0ABD5U254_9EURY
MVPDSSTSDADPSGADETYDAVHRATRDAVWYVVGTATLMLFHLALAALCLSLAYAGIGPFLAGSAPATAAAFGGVALSVGLFSAYRVYTLATE